MKKTIITMFGILVLSQPAFAGFKEHYDLAQQYLANYQYSSAITEFKSALRINFLDNSARIGLVNSYLARGAYFANTEKNYNKAADDYRSALFYLSYYPNLNNVKNSSQAILQVDGNLQRCLESTKFDMTPQSRFNKAKQLRAEGNFAAAGYEFNQALGDKALVKDSFAQVGDIMRLLGNDQKSAEYYRKAVAAAPGDIDLRLSYAKTLDKLGTEDLAVEEYNYILTKSINNKDVLYSLERIYKKKLEANPSDAGTIANLGAILQKQNKLDEALSYYQKAETVDPSNINTRINVGTLYQQKGDNKTAMVAYDSVLVLYPDNVQANLYKAQCLAALGDDKMAQTFYKKVLSLDPQNELAQNELFNSAKASMTTAEFVEYVKKNAGGAEASGILYNYALDLHKQNKLDEAIMVYSEVAKSTNNPEVFLNLAIAQGQQKNFNGALATLNNANAKFPNNTQITKAMKDAKDEITDAQYGKAAEYFNNKDYQNAINEYLKVQPATSDSMIGVASAYQSMDNNTKAIEYYQKALALKPTDSDIAYYIGVLYAEAENWNSAQEYLKKAVALNKNNQKATDYLQTIVEQNNITMLNDAIQLYEAEKYDESLKLLNNIIAVDGKNAYAYYYRGMIYDVKVKRLEAIADFKKAIALNPAELEIVNYLIAADLDALARYKEAYGYYKKYSISTAPEDDYKKYAKARINELKQYAQ